MVFLFVFVYRYIYISIVIHRQICFVLSELISVASSSWDRNPVDSNANPKLLTILPRGDISCEVNFKRLWITITIVYIHPFNGGRDLNSSTKRLAIDANGKTITSTPEKLNPTGVGEYIYIYIYICVCVCMCVCVCVCVCVTFFLSFCYSVSQSLFLPVSNLRYLSLTLSICFYSLLSLPPSITFSFSLFFPFLSLHLHSVSPSSYLPPSLPASLSLSLSLSSHLSLLSTPS